MALLDMPAALPLRQQLAASQDKLVMLLGAPQQQAAEATPMAADGAGPAGGSARKRRGC
jgi:predicted lipid-binding transport protein (Tim44 family)